MTRVRASSSAMISTRSCCSAKVSVEGRVRNSATKSASSEASFRTLAITSTKTSLPESHSVLAPAFPLDSWYSSAMLFCTSRCTASQRLNPSVSFAARNARSSSETVCTSLTGAENMRSADRTGLSLSLSKAYSCSFLVTCNTVSLPSSGMTVFPVRSNKAIRSGICNAGLSVCPGVSGTLCLTVRT